MTCASTSCSPAALVATDVTITSALHTAATPAATVTQRYAAEQAAKKKIEKYGAAAAEANIDFVPLAVDTFGCWCEAN